MQVTTEIASFIDRLRDAAKEHGAVYELLCAIDNSILIDESGNREITGDDDDVRLLMASSIARAFAALDRKEEA